MLDIRNQLESMRLESVTQMLLHKEQKDSISVKDIRILRLWSISGILYSVAKQISRRNQAWNIRRCQIHVLTLTCVLSDYVIEEKTATLQKRDSEGFGFVLRGAKGSVNVNVCYSQGAHTLPYTHTCLLYANCVMCACVCVLYYQLKLQLKNSLRLLRFLRCNIWSQWIWMGWRGGQGYELGTSWSRWGAVGFKTVYWAWKISL